MLFDIFHAICSIIDIVFTIIILGIVIGIPVLAIHGFRHRNDPKITRDRSSDEHVVIRGQTINTSTPNASGAPRVTARSNEPMSDDARDWMTPPPVNEWNS